MPPISALYSEQRSCTPASCALSSPRINLETQRELFQIALGALGENLVNQVLEVAEDEEGEVTVSTYEHPPG
jgi:hypothetical protein